MTNVPAERLRNRIRQDHGDHEGCKFMADLEAALAEERQSQGMAYGSGDGAKGMPSAISPSRLHSPDDPPLGSHVPTQCTFCGQPWPCEGHRMEQADAHNGRNGYARGYSDGYRDGAAGKFFDPGIDAGHLRRAVHDYKEGGAERRPAPTTASHEHGQRPPGGPE